MKILVADDDSVNRKYLHALLSHEGHTVIECEDGVATLAYLEQNPCDAVISDMLIPQMDGYRLCYEIRKNIKLKNTPVILYTATNVCAADEKAAKAMGADKFVRKPAHPEQILEALNAAIETCRAKNAVSLEKPGDLSALREYSEVIVRKLEETNVELSVANATLAENERRLRAIIESEPECVKILARDGTLLEMNPAGLRMIDADSASSVIGKKIDGLIVPEHRRSFQNLTEAAFNGASGTLEFEVVSLKENRRWFDTHVVPLRNSSGQIVAVLGITRDITEQRHNAALLNGQMRVLEMIARGAPLSATLDVLLRMIEDQCNDMFCSILLLDSDGPRLKHCSAPRLPPRYIEAIDGTAIGEAEGSCGTAIYRREQVIVEDIATNPLWIGWRELALSHGLRACWSTPIFDAQQQVLGSFAMYFHTPRRPTDAHSRLINVATHMAAVAISKQREEDALRESESRFREMADSAPVMIWMTGRDGACNYVNRQWINFTEQAKESAFGLGWLNAVHPADRERIDKSFSDAKGCRISIRLEYRMRRGDGEYRWVIDSAQPRLSERGEFLGYIGSVFDISERKQAEDQRQQNLQRVRTLHEINLAITSTLDLQAVLHVLMEKIIVLLPFSAATTIRLINRTTGALENTACLNIDEAQWKARIGQGNRNRSEEIFRTKRPVIVANMQDEPGVSAASFYRKYGFISYLGVPLIVKDEVQGILAFYTKEAHEFSQDEVDLLLTVAGQAAIAINNARLYDDITLAKADLETSNRSLDRSLKRLDSLYSTFAPLTPGASNQEVMDAIIGRLIEATGADAGLIRIWDAETKNYRVVNHRGYPGAFLERVGTAPRAGAVDWVVQHGEPILAPDIATDNRFQGKAQLDYGLRSSAVLPLSTQDDIRGVMQLSSQRQGYFDEEHKDHLMAIARQMSIAMENRRLFNDLKFSRDSLARANAALTESNRMLTALHAVASASNQSLNLQQILQAAIERMTEIFNFDATRIHLYDKQRETLVLRASFEQDPEHFAPARVFQRGTGIVGAVARSGEKMIFADAPNDPRYRALTSKTITGKHSHRFLAVFPINGKTASVGTITCVSDAPRSLGGAETQLLEAIADQLAIAIENSSLYEDVRARVDDLQIKTLELERANRVKDEFLGVVSHELRTPINVIMGYTSLFKAGVLGSLKPRQEEALAKITWEAKELLAMINTLLYATTLETEEVTIESQEFDPEILLEELRANYAVTAPSQVIIEWHYPESLPTLNTDRRKLKQVLDNLIGNAIKFTEAGTVTVAVNVIDSTVDFTRKAGHASPQKECQPPQASALAITVSDTGVGMPADKLDKIFDKFYQVDSSGTRRFGGVGLGLYIARHFTDLLGGRLAVASTQGVGATFTLTVPITAAPKSIRSQCDDRRDAKN